MIRTLLSGSALCLVLTAAAAAEPAFNRIASFPVPANLPADAGADTETSAEIIAASDDGMTLVYTDSPLGALGFVDLTDPKAPAAGGVVMLEGEPTSVAVQGGKAFVGVNTSESYTDPSGHLAVVDILSRELTESCDLGGQPDSVALSDDGAMLAVAIENERDEDLNDGVIPQLPAGNVVIVPIEAGTPDCARLKTVDLTGLAAIAGEDPEPEFVDFNAAGELVVTLQENNHIALIDTASGTVTGSFSAGAVDLAGIDAEEDGALDFTAEQAGRLREPDAVKWLDEERFVTANEGDYEGGSRSFTIFSKDGSVLFESGPALEDAIIRIGHYPEGRSDSKGVEPEGLEIATFDDQRYIFVLTERASVVGVYRDTGDAPELVQLLPSGIGPEGAVAIPSRNLFVTANETDLVEDGGARAHVMVYALEDRDGPPAYPTLVSGQDEAGRPIGWGALSGLAADPEAPGLLYAVSDSFFAAQPTLFTIDASSTPAEITAATRITRDGQPAEGLDLEGVVADGEGGFWLASEGDSEEAIPHALYHVDAGGAIDREVTFPEALLAGETRFGAEGITSIGEGDDTTLWIALQREWEDDPKDTVKLVSYQPASETWGAVWYPIEKAEQGWIGLSEITAAGDAVYVVERDDQLGEAARVKRLYRVPLEELQPGELGGEMRTVWKEEVLNFLPELQAFNGYVTDKVEGFAIDAAGEAFAVTDNDGVDDSAGETLFLRLGKL
jgi:DNA-binding beta-propeller fold protein YncE